MLDLLHHDLFCCNSLSQQQTAYSHSTDLKISTKSYKHSLMIFWVHLKIINTTKKVSSPCELYYKLAIENYQTNMASLNMTFINALLGIKRLCETQNLQKFEKGNWELRVTF